MLVLVGQYLTAPEFYLGGQQAGLPLSATSSILWLAKLGLNIQGSLPATISITITLQMISHIISHLNSSVHDHWIMFAYVTCHHPFWNYISHWLLLGTLAYFLVSLPSMKSQIIWVLVSLMSSSCLPQTVLSILLHPCCFYGLPTLPRWPSMAVLEDIFLCHSPVIYLFHIALCLVVTKKWLSKCASHHHNWLHLLSQGMFVSKYIFQHVQPMEDLCSEAGAWK